MVRDIINATAPRPAMVPTPNPGPSAQIPPEVLEHLVNPPRNFPVPPVPYRPEPLVVPSRPEPFASPSWEIPDWAAGILIPSLLGGLLLCGYFARKRTAR